MHSGVNGETTCFPHMGRDRESATEGGRWPQEKKAIERMNRLPRVILGRDSHKLIGES